MRRIPTKITPRLLAAQLLIHRVAPRPRTKFGSDGIGGNNLRFTIADTEPPLNGACDLAHWKATDRRTYITSVRYTTLQRQRVKNRKILAVNKRPPHMLAPDNADCVSFNGVFHKTTKDTSAGFVHHSGMDDDRIDALSIEDALQVPHHPGESWKGTEGCGFRGHSIASRAKQPAAGGVDKFWLLLSSDQMRQETIKEAALDIGHRAREIAGHMYDSLQRRKRTNPSLRRSNVPRKRRSAKFDDLSRRAVGARQRDYIVSPPDEFTQYMTAYFTSAPQNENAHQSPRSAHRAKFQFIFVIAN